MITHDTSTDLSSTDQDTSSASLNSYLKLIFNLRGTLGRTEFFLGALSLVFIAGFLVFMAIFIAAMMSEENTIGALLTDGQGYLPLLAIGLYCYLAMSIKRARQCGHNAYVCLLLLVPLVNVIFALYLHICPSRCMAAMVTDTVS